MWHNVLAGLAGLVDLRFVDEPGARRKRLERRPDVWLSDGHQGPLPVSEPSVVQIQEAAWHIPEVRDTLDPAFIEAYAEPSRRACRAATGIITPSESSRRQVVDTYDVSAEKVRAVPLGVDADRFRPGRPGAADVLARAGADPARPYVLCVSVAHPRKNLGALRSAMAALAGDGFPHNLALVVSPAADRADSRALLDEVLSDLPGAPGRVVRLTGLGEDDLASVIAGAAAFCLPSLMEGFGLPSLEAMACGVPVVVSNRGSLPEIVGDAGLVIEPDADSVAEALASVLGDAGRAAALGAAARRRSLEFGWDRTVRGWLDVVEQA
jgi:glycosyltransferase involved in cell wall biosynthesis